MNAIPSTALSKQSKELYILEGVVTDREIVVRQTKSGRKVANVLLKINIPVMSEGDGGPELVERQRDVAIYDEKAEEAARELKAGMLIKVQGKPVPVSYEYKGKIQLTLRLLTSSYEILSSESTVEVKRRVISPVAR